MQLTSTLLVMATALSGLSYAHPHLHALHHRHHHDARAATELDPRQPEEHQLEARKPLNFVKAVKPSSTTTSSAAAKTPTAAAAPAPAATKPAAPLANVNTATTDSAAYRPFCGGATSKRATAANIAMVGNTGVAGNWGCNMMTIPASIANLYDYKASFTTTGGDWSCACFNKIGPTGQIDGFWHTAISFTVSGSQTQWVAFDKNTQGACACGPGASPPKTSIGQWAGTWLEIDMGDAANGGNSGADASVLVAGSAGLPYYGMSVSNNGNLCSWVKSNGNNFAAYMPGMEDADGVGCKGYYLSNLSVVLGD